MEGLGNRMLVREYLTDLPEASELAAEVARAKELLERQAESRRLARQSERRHRASVCGRQAGKVERRAE